MYSQGADDSGLFWGSLNHSLGLWRLCKIEIRYSGQGTYKFEFTNTMKGSTIALLCVPLLNSKCDFFLGGGIFPSVLRNIFVFRISFLLWVYTALNTRMNVWKEREPESQGPWVPIRCVYLLCVCVSHSVMSDSWDPMEYSLPGSHVHGILQARTLEWVAIPFSRLGFPTPSLNLGHLHCRQILYHLSHQRSP